MEANGQVYQRQYHPGCTRQLGQCADGLPVREYPSDGSAGSVQMPIMDIGFGLRAAHLQEVPQRSTSQIEGSTVSEREVAIRKG